MRAYVYSGKMDVEAEPPEIQMVRSKQYHLDVFWEKTISFSFVWQSSLCYRLSVADNELKLWSYSIKFELRICGCYLFLPDVRITKIDNQAARNLQTEK